jgi:hypothetical protein
LIIVHGSLAVSHQAIRNVRPPRVIFDNPCRKSTLAAEVTGRIARIPWDFNVAQTVRMGLAIFAVKGLMHPHSILRDSPVTVIRTTNGITVRQAFSANGSSLEVSRGASSSPGPAAETAAICEPRLPARPGVSFAQ